MIIAYDSKTGNVKRFVKKLNLKSFQIEDNIVCKEPFVLITYTTGFGNIPQKTLEFLKNNYPFLIGVSASGNRNWGSSFAKSGDTISQQYNIPLLSKFELSGTNQDVEQFLLALNQL